MTIVPAEGALLEQILDHTFQIWNEGLPRPAYGQWNRAQVKTPWARSRLQRYASIDEDGRLLATAKQYRFDVRVGDREGWMCGIGAVFTPPEHRGRGHASALIEHLVSRAQRDGALLASLFSEIGAPFYERLGFTGVPLDEVTVTVDRKKGGAPAMLVRAGEERDLDNRGRHARGAFGVSAVCAAARRLACPLRVVEEDGCSLDSVRSVCVSSSSSSPRKARQRSPTSC